MNLHRKIANACHNDSARKQPQYSGRLNRCTKVEMRRINRHARRRADRLLLAEWLREALQ